MEVTRDKTSDEICLLLDIERGTLDRYCAMGLPCFKGGRGKSRRFNEAEVSVWLRDNKKTTKVGRPKSGGEELEKVRIRKETALARRYEIEVAKAEGEVINRAEVEAANVQKIIAIRNKLLGLASSIVCSPEVAAAIDKRVGEILEELSHK